jgi:DNA replication protein DnaC
MKMQSVNGLVEQIYERMKAEGLCDPKVAPDPRPCVMCAQYVEARWIESSSGRAYWQHPSSSECPSCAEQKKAADALEAFERRMDLADIPPRLRQWSLFKEVESRTGLASDKHNHALAKLCVGWDQASWIIASGSVGSGKTTWLSALMVDHVALGNFTKAVWITEQGFFRRASLKAEEQFTGREQELERLVKADLLMIDDLGAGRRALTDWQGGAIRDLIVDRHLYERPTFISTNLAEHEIASRYGEHVSSRLIEMSGGLVRVNGPDRRRR